MTGTVNIIYGSYLGVKFSKNASNPNLPISQSCFFIAKLNFLKVSTCFSFCAKGHRKQKNKKVSSFSLIFELIPHWLAQICSGRSGSFSTPLNTVHCRLYTCAGATRDEYFQLRNTRDEYFHQP